MDCGGSAKSCDANYALKRCDGCAQSCVAENFPRCDDSCYARNYSCAKWNDVWLP